MYIFNTNEKRFFKHGMLYSMHNKYVLEVYDNPEQHHFFEVNKDLKIVKHIRSKDLTNYKQLVSYTYSSNYILDIFSCNYTSKVTISKGSLRGNLTKDVIILLNILEENIKDIIIFKNIA